MMKPLYTVFFLTFGISYFFVEKAGLFSGHPLVFMEILYSKQILATSVLMLVVMLVGIMKNARNAGIAGWLQVISVFLIIAGLWLSYLTRFSGEVAITEGQTFQSATGQYLPKTLYRGRFSDPPHMGITLETLEPVFSGDGTVLKSLSGRFLIVDAKSGNAVERTITDRFPAFIGNLLLSVRDFGYSPRYELKSNAGRVLDSSFMYMRLFPPGSEDNFRLLSPLTYYVRYEPGTENSGQDPVITLRITRNKDIVFNDEIEIAKNVDFENNKISFPEVRMWTKLSITRDWGLLTALAGLIFGLAYITAACVRAVRK